MPKIGRAGARRADVIARQSAWRASRTRFIGEAPTGGLLAAIAGRPSFLALAIEPLRGLVRAPLGVCRLGGRRGPGGGLAKAIFWPLGRDDGFAGVLVPGGIIGRWRTSAPDRAF